MRFISHRGNLSGPGTAEFGENHPDSIKSVLKAGHDCEIDLWLKDGEFYLGHDAPEHEVDEDFTYQNKLWIHAKNFEALNYIASDDSINGFFHDKDDYTMTTKGFIWTYPRKSLKLNERSVAVMPELIPGWKGLDRCYGICSDFIAL